jgi:hypothetical protein
MKHKVKVSLCTYSDMILSGAVNCIVICFPRLPVYIQLVMFDKRLALVVQYQNHGMCMHIWLRFS